MSGVRVEENVTVFIIFFQKRIKATNTDSKTSQTIKK